MSLDLDLRCEHGYGPWAALNITHNVRPICRAAGCDPWEWQGRAVADVLPELDAAIRALEAEPDAYQHLAPANGWGSVHGTLRFLLDVRAHAREYADDASLRWWVCR